VLTHFIICHSHWPNCNWCSRGTTHLANPGDGDSDPDPDLDPPDPDTVPDDSDLYPDGGDMDYNGSDGDDAQAISDALGAMSAGNIPAPAPVNSTAGPALDSSTAATKRRAPRNIAPKMRMQKVRRVSLDLDKGLYVVIHHSTTSWADSSTDTSTSTWSDDSADSQSNSLTDPSTDALPPSSTNGHSVTPTFQPLESAADLPKSPIRVLPLPTNLPTSVLPTSGDSTQTSDHIINGTPAPAQAPAKTRPVKASCTPSPTSSLAPSASESLSSRLSVWILIIVWLTAWTTCPYVGRDGQVNPDVRLLNGPEAINNAAQSILYNAIAYALQKTSSYSTAAASFIDTFFLNPSTKMNPNMNFGQMVRGPGQSGQEGTFTGVLDLRGIVKIINGILILKAADSPDWTTARNQELATWMGQYADWLRNSPLGKLSASRPK
jgi:hypothetical protein